MRTVVNAGLFPILLGWMPVVTRGLVGEREGTWLALCILTKVDPRFNHKASDRQDFPIGRFHLDKKTFQKLFFFWKRRTSVEIARYSAKQKGFHNSGFHNIFLVYCSFAWHICQKEEEKTQHCLNLSLRRGIDPLSVTSHEPFQDKEKKRWKIRAFFSLLACNL